MDWLFEDLDFTPSDTERLIVSRSGPKNHQSVQIKKEEEEQRQLQLQNTHIKAAREPHIRSD